MVSHRDPWSGWDNAVLVMSDKRLLETDLPSRVICSGPETTLRQPEKTTYRLQTRQSA